MSGAKKHRSAKRLTDDLLFEIVARLPAKSLVRFRCVSKAWYVMEYDPYYRKRLPPTMSGLFYNTRIVDGSHTLGSYCRWKSNLEYVSILNNGAVNTSLDFLPPHRNLRIMDCCSGLLLCCLWNTDSLSTAYCVCNPATRKWFALPKPYKEFHSLLLAFDPQISQHYAVIRFQRSQGSDSMDLEVFSSDSGKWLESQVPWRQDTGFLRRRQRVFLNGVLHILCYRHHIVGIDLQIKSCRRIEPPNAARMMYKAFLGQSGGYLHYLSVHESQIQVYILEDYSSNEWVLKHSTDINCIIEQLYIEEIHRSSSSSRSSYRFAIVAFHPDVDVLFLRANGKLFSYHFSSRRLTSICSLKERSLPWFYVFSPCWSDVPEGIDV